MRGGAAFYELVAIQHEVALFGCRSADGIFFHFNNSCFGKSNGAFSLTCLIQDYNANNMNQNTCPVGTFLVPTVKGCRVASEVLELSEGAISPWSHLLKGCTHHSGSFWKFNRHLIGKANNKESLTCKACIKT